jgi:hypothetical protein
MLIFMKNSCEQKPTDSISRDATRPGLRQQDEHSTDAANATSL